MIDLAHAYLPSLVGGMLIGLSAGLFYLGEGRIAGISSIARALFDGEGWRLAFLAGLVGAGLLFGLLSGQPVAALPAKPLVLVVGGLLVGFGSGLGSGCTSGHGVCGLARFSPRSLVAVLVFVGTASVTVFLMRHGVGR